MLAWLSVLLLAFGAYWIEGSVEAANLGIDFPLPIGSNQSMTWTYGSAVYWSIVTATTIGYGDMSPKTTGGKLWVMFIGTLAIFILLAFISHMSNWIIDRVKKGENGAIFSAMRSRCGGYSCFPWLAKARVGLVVTALYILLIVIGGALFGYGEPFAEPQYMNGIYFSWVTLSTVGYGDVLCTRPILRAFVCIYSIFGIALYSFIVSVLAKNLGTRMQPKSQRSLIVATSSLEALEERLKYLNDEHRKPIIDGLREVLQKYEQAHTFEEIQMMDL